MYQSQIHKQANRTIKDFGQVSKFMNYSRKLTTLPHKSSNHREKNRIRCSFHSKKNSIEHNVQDVDGEKP